MGDPTIDTLEKVASEFEGEVLMELQEGRAQSLALIENSRKETREAVAKILETSVRQVEALEKQIVGSAELEARNSQLKAMEAAVADVFSSAAAQVSKLSGQRYEASLNQLLKEAVSAIGVNAMVSCSSRDAKLVFSTAKGIKGEHVKLTPGDKTLKTIGGVVLTTPDRSVRFDNTFEARLERMRPILRKEVAALLSG